MKEGGVISAMDKLLAG